MAPQPELKVGMLLPKVLSIKIAGSNKALAPIGLTHSAWVVLNCIARNPGKSTHALAESCFVTDQSFGQMVAKLADQGLLVRKPGFGKAILHALTGDGQRLVAEAEPLLEEALRSLLSGLSRRERETLGDLLERVVSQNAQARPGEPLRTDGRHATPPSRGGGVGEALLK